MADSHHQHVHLGPIQRPGAGRALVKDPVCKMDVVPGQAAGDSAEHGGTTYWFCNPRCREKFVADPARYLAAAPETPPASDPRSASTPAKDDSRPPPPAANLPCAVRPAEESENGSADK